MVTSILKQDAIDNIWCEPFQDFQHVLKPQRLTAAGGAYKTLPMQMSEIRLPNYSDPLNRDRFHVYQIGFQWRTSFQIQLDTKVWIRADNLMKGNRLLVDTYFDNGCMLLRTDVFVQFTDSSNMLVGIRINNSVDMGTEQWVDPITGVLAPRKYILEHHTPTIRFYSSSYYRSDEWRTNTIAPLDPVRTHSATIKTVGDYTTFISYIDSLKISTGNEGRIMFWVNGYLESIPTGFATRFINSTFTVVWESAIKSVVRLPGKDLTSFISELDINYRKYIVLSNEDYGVVDYQDDIDIYITRRSGLTWKGVVVSRFLPASVRQITHNCYALDAGVVKSILDSQPWLGKITDIELLLVIRHSGITHGLKQQAVRIEELYRLNRAGIIEAMQGVNSLMPEWKASFLENSQYCKIMRTEMSKITETMVEEAYGYNAATLVAERFTHTPELVGHQYQMDIPPAMCIPDNKGYAYRSFYMYDQQGHYLALWDQYALTRRVVLPEQNVPLGIVETLHSRISTQLDGCTYKYTFTDPDLKHWGFRCYACSISNGVPNEIWDDVTDSDLYEYNPKTHTLTWDRGAMDQYGLYPCVKIGKYTHIYEGLPLNDRWTGVLEITVQSEVDWDNSVSVRPQRLEPGTVDVLVNGYSLIEDLDYIVDWPKIIIVRRMADPIDYSKAHTIIRSRGWCDPKTMRHSGPREVGWLKDNMLSKNGVYDPRRDRNIRLVIDGAVQNPSHVIWSEDLSRPLLKEVFIPDGRAYAVSDVYNVVEPWTEQSTVPYRAKAQQIDQRVSEYLTPRMEEPVEYLPTVSGQRWGLYSPFLSVILHRLSEQGWLTNGELSDPWDGNDVTVWVQPYMYLLKYDPCLKDLDANYVWIYPHPYYDAVSITREQYRLVDYIVRHYLRSKIDLTTGIMIRG